MYQLKRNGLRNVHFMRFCLTFYATSTESRTSGAMAFKRSAVRSRLSPPKVLKTIGFQHFFIFRCLFGWIFRPLEYSANLSHSRGVVMARISMRNVQKSPVSEYFDLFLLSLAAARGVKDKTLSAYKQHFHSISKNWM